MDDVQQNIGRSSSSESTSDTSSGSASDPFDANAAGDLLSAEHEEQAPNSLNVSYLQRAPSQLASNHRWYKDNLSQVEDKTVRLLYLEPGQPEDPVVGRLVCHPVKNKTRYDALSYSWGEQDEWAEITLNGVTGFAVTKSLWCGLRRLRSKAIARPIWIDAICIDQCNTAERNQQVSMMDSTFGNARSVLIWLGDCEDDEIASGDKYHPVHDILLKLERDTRDATRAWWNRLWVVQEVALAKELMVYFGPHVLSWADFFSSAESKPYFKAVVNLRTARTFVQSHGFARKDEVSLEELLGLTGNCFASDPLDYVFGVISLVPGQRLLQRHGLSPNYTLTPYELFTRLNGYLGSERGYIEGTTMLNKMLSWTASIGHLQLAKLLLDSDQINLEAEGSLVLRYAAENGQISMLRMLLDEFHLNPDTRDTLGRTCLFWAAARAQSEVVKLLIHKYNADSCTGDFLGQTPLALAAANDTPAIHGFNAIIDTVQIFLDRPEVDPDAEDALGRTPLAWAVRAGSEPVVRLLLDTGRTNPARHFDGQPLLAWAFEYQNFTIARLLMARGAPSSAINTKHDWNRLVASGEAGPFNHYFWSDGLGKGGEVTEHPPAYESVADGRWNGLRRL